MSPVGALRWADPVEQPPLPAGQVFDATIDGPPCVQPMPNASKVIIGDEDCLWLKVSAPARDDGGRGKDETKKRLKPIMLFIHGGAYHAGTVNGKWTDYKYDGAHFVENSGGNVVFVEIQVR